MWHLCCEMLTGAFIVHIHIKPADVCLHKHKSWSQWRVWRVERSTKRIDKFLLAKKKVRREVKRRNVKLWWWRMRVKLDYKEDMRRKSRRYLWFDYNKSLLRQFVGLWADWNGFGQDEMKMWGYYLRVFAALSNAWWNFHLTFRLTSLALSLSVESQINSSKLFSGTIMAHHFHWAKEKAVSSSFVS